MRDLYLLSQAEHGPLPEGDPEAEGAPGHAGVGHGAHDVAKSGASAHLEVGGGGRVPVVLVHHHPVSHGQGVRGAFNYQHIAGHGY